MPNVNGNDLPFNYAHSYCSNLFFGGFDDWLLPIREELIQIHLSGLNFIPSDIYFWTNESYGSNLNMNYIRKLNDSPTFSL